MKESTETYVTEKWGVIVFHESPKDWGPIKTCRHCVLRDTIEDCRRAACSPEFRVDGKDGYFTAQDIPNPEKT